MPGDGPLRCHDPMASEKIAQIERGAGSAPLQLSAALRLSRARRRLPHAHRALPSSIFAGSPKQYPSGDTGLEQVTFSVEREEFVFLVGSTGSGKSTVMRLLIKELEPTAGTISVAGRDLHDIRRKRVPYYRRNVGGVPGLQLLPNKTVYENVAYALGDRRAEARVTIRERARDPAS